MLALWAFSAVGCKSEDAKELARAVLGPEGGTLAGGGWTLEVPAGALTTETEIVLTTTRGDLSERDFVQHGDAVAFDPPGLALRLPAALRADGLPEMPAILFEQDGSTVAAVGSTAYVNELSRAARAEAGTVTTEVAAPELAATFPLDGEDLPLFA